MVVLFCVETQWSLVHTNFRPAFLAHAVIEVSCFLPFHVSPVDNCHCGYRQLSDVAIACTFKAPPLHLDEIYATHLGNQIRLLRLDLVL